MTGIRGDIDDPFSKGHICPKGVALQDVHEDADRLRKPMKRTAAGWEETSWDDALDTAARGLHETQTKYGRDALATYVGNPSVHNLGSLIFFPLLLRTLRSRNGYSATSVDQLPQMVAAFAMFGHGLLVPIPDVDRTSWFLVLGANPVASNGSLMTAPGIANRMDAIRDRGGKVVVVDPRRTETARAASEHHFIRPGSDALFLLSLLRELFVLGPRLRHLADLTDGLATLAAVVSEFPPSRTEAHTGIARETVERLARELHAAESAACYGRVGLSTQPFGGLASWLVNAVNLVTGNLDREGGAMFTQPAFDPLHGPKALRVSPGGLGRWKSRVRGLPEFMSELPVAALAEEILTEGEGQVQGLLTVAGNPVLSTPNGGQLDRALARLPFMVSVDPFLNETTRHAHVILPPTTPLERGHYDLAFHVLAVRNTAKYSAPLFPKPDGALHDWEILLELQHRVEVLRDGPTAAEETRYRFLKRRGPEGILDLGLRFGPYGRGLFPSRRGMSLRKLRSAPHGIDLGPLRPCLPERLLTKTKRIELAPELFLGDLARLRAAFPDGAPAGGGLVLIGRRNVRDNNSWMHNVPRLMRGASRCTLFLHPEDAKARGLAAGDTAEVRSRVGAVLVPVTVTEDVMPGVVSLPHGYGHSREGVRARLATQPQHAGVSLNDLTDDQTIDALVGTAAFSGVPVEVARPSCRTGQAGA
ncbi:MAG: molybdopterin-dependent oxidoreductase [Acidobacteria bacterium]|nr:molybdopterin-dependent oxidoreductase [Acidobacteriota bacterium]